jgi:hypothetical protein
VELEQVYKKIARRRVSIYAVANSGTFQSIREDISQQQGFPLFDKGIVVDGIHFICLSGQCGGVNASVRNEPLPLEDS